MLDQEKIKANIDSMLKQGASREQVQGYLDNLKVQAQPTPKDEQMNFFQSLLKPFTKVGVSGAVTLAGGVAAGAKLLGQDEFAQNVGDATTKMAKEGFDVPLLGNVRPFGTQLLNEDMGTGEAIFRTGADIAGTGAEIASYAFTPLKIASKAGWFKTLINPASLKAVAPFAVPFALGKAGQALGEGKGTGDSLLEGAGAYLGAALGFNMFSAGGTILGNFGARLMKSPIIKAQAEKLADLADVIVNAVPKGVREKIGETFSWNSRMYQKEYETAHKKLVDGMIDEFSTQAPTGDEAFQGYRQNLNKYITAQYEKKANDFADVFADPHRVASYPTTKVAINKAKAEVDTLIKSGLYDSGQALQNYIGRVEGLLGNGYNKPQSLKIVDALYSGADAFIGKSNAEDALIREISHAILDDATLSVSQKAPELLNRWNQARTFAQDISTNVNSEFAGKMKNAPRLNNFVDSLITGTGPSREEMTAFNRAFSPEERNDISQSVFNSIMSKVKTAKTPEEGAAIIDKTLKNLSQYGDDNLINPGHGSQLENLSSLMKENFQDFMFRAQGISKEEVTKVAQQKIQQNLTDDMVKLADANRYSELGDRISKITGVEEVQAVLKLTAGDKELEKGIGQEVMRGLFSKNKDIFVGEKGKYDFSGFFNDLNKIGGPNKDEVFNSIFTSEQKGYVDYLFKLRESIGSLENLKGENLLRFAHGLTGLMYSFTGRVVPATYHLSQIMKVSSKNKIPFAQLRDLAGELSSEGKVKESIFAKLGDKIKEQSKIGGMAGQQEGPTIESFFKAAESLFGRPLDDKDKQELEAVFNEK